METQTRHTAGLGPLALLAALVLMLVPALAAVPALGATVSPLPRSEYTTRAVCASPAPLRAGCLAVALEPRTAKASARSRPLGVSVAASLPARSPAAGDFGLRPQDLHSGYALPTSAPSTQTIAIVDAYNDPTAAGDLAAYDEEFSLPACTVQNGCFRQVNETGEAGPLPFPTSTQELEAARKGSSQERKRAAVAGGWGVEISLDIESAHAVCQSCKILLVESESPSYADLETAERAAETLGASEISNSWGGPEQGVTPAIESAGPFDHPGTVITASAGDNGYLGSAAATSSERGYAEFPASSPHVVAVGGTRLTLAAGGTRSGETVWNDSGQSEGLSDGFGAGGGGCSAVFAAPAWQRELSNWSAVGCPRGRAIADVAADADPYTGLAVHDSSPECEYSFEGRVSHWCTIGGTSLASPVIAAVFALAGGAHGVQYPARTLYEDAALEPTSLHDVSAGSNGACAKPFQESTGEAGCTAAEDAANNCESLAICLAGAGYDGASGLGTPAGITAFGASRQASSKAEVAAGGEAGAPPEGKPKGAETSGSESSPPPPAAGAPLGSGGAASSTPAPLNGPAIVVSVPRITALSLTRAAILALDVTRPRIARVGFSFTLTAPSRVRVSLLRAARVHGRLRWVAASHSFATSAGGGRNSAHLRGSGHIAAGLYRLTLTLAAGPSRTVLFHIG